MSDERRAAVQVTGIDPFAWKEIGLAPDDLPVIRQNMEANLPSVVELFFSDIKAAA